MAIQKLYEESRPGNLPGDTPAGPQKGALKNGIVSSTFRTRQPPS